MKMFALQIVLFSLVLPLFSASAIGKQHLFRQNGLLRGSTDPAVFNRLESLSRQVQEKSCRVNLCFVLQGDDFVTELEFNSQKSFAELLVSVLSGGPPTSLCAVQYANKANPILPITEDRTLFSQRLSEAQKIGGRNTNIFAGLDYARAQLKDQNGVNKVIFFGDGIDTTGANPISVAKTIRDDGGKICSVAVGNANTNRLQNIAGSADLVFSLSEFFDVLQVIESFIQNVCE